MVKILSVLLMVLVPLLFGTLMVPLLEAIEKLKRGKK